jgi:serine/threonine-protein kinase
MHYQDRSLEDVRTYIQNRVNGSEQLRQQIAKRGETEAEFIDKIAIKSENNFMYLVYVLQDIEQARYQDLSLEQFPQGLQGYYNFHFQDMGMYDKPLPEAKIKLVYILGEVRQPVSREKLCDFSGEDARTVQPVLKEWRKFLHEHDQYDPIRYSVYHASFRDFLHHQDILEKTGVTIPGINQLIAKEQLNKWKKRRRHE